MRRRYAPHSDPVSEYAALAGRPQSIRLRERTVCMLDQLDRCADDDARRLLLKTGQARRREPGTKPAARRDKGF